MLCRIGQNDVPKRYRDSQQLPKRDQQHEHQVHSTSTLDIFHRFTWWTSKRKPCLIDVVNIWSRSGWWGLAFATGCDLPAEQTKDYQGEEKYLAFGCVYEEGESVGYGWEDCWGRQGEREREREGEGKRESWGWRVGAGWGGEWDGAGEETSVRGHQIPLITQLQFKIVI